MASRRGYLSQTELADFADIIIDDATEADDRISQAEEIIDAYVGPQNQFIDKTWSDIEGKMQSVSGNVFQLEARHCSVFLNDFFKGCEVEIIGGTGSGQRTIITTSTYAGFVTGTSFSPTIDITSFYRIYQLGKFPRKRDVYLDAINPPIPIYYKNIPEEIKRATAAQVEYMINQGDAYFRTDDIFKNQERIGDYEYQKSRDGSGAGITQLIAPKAKWFLNGFVNRKGVMVV